MSQQSEFGKRYLQDRIVSEFALARHLGIVVESAADTGIVLCAPLAANVNDKGSAFGGSLFSVAVLTGWAWVARYLAAASLRADAMIQDSAMQYLAPVRGELRGGLAAPPADQIARFSHMLRRAGRGRIRLRVDIHDEQILAARFEGVYAALIR